jgi:hypothetical protein
MSSFSDGVVEVLLGPANKKNAGIGTTLVRTAHETAAVHAL